MKIDIVLLVYNRIDDLRHCLSIIKDTWISHDYHIIVSSNGRNAGYLVDNEILSKIDTMIESENDKGKLGGQSSLVLNGLTKVRTDSDYVIILEADTWIYSDRIINKYTEQLEKSNALWASAKWYDRFFSLAIDFAIIKAKYLQTNAKIFDITVYSECYYAQYLINDHQKYIHITENMPVMVPGYLKKYPFAPKGRFFAFPKSQMVTHHIELCKKGFETKKRHFNIVSKTKYFDIKPKFSDKFLLFLMKFSQATVTILPKRSWFKSHVYYDFKKNIISKNNNCSLC